ncbi:hypothetical protein BJF79_41270 [Actinomadura sp. CNU-125]|uniref:hypothetical protein n=1 Tax=Actinomadura sp. CNU-125 TaxID=1904961 RepID=UPI0009615B2F|nr:hypothetical protein [Actinomadura sp. CNU-125]OLT28882.1 hypothetical protein BJF79_41270 [Actinomadura sp. CNU-125]
MGCTPELVTAHSVDVPDEEAARAVAAFMVERGYTTVRVFPQAVDGWTATGLDEGPYPDDDDRWWRAVEARAVEAAAGEFGGGVRRSLAHAETARAVFPGGETVAERAADEVRGARLAAFAEEPARASEPGIVHRLDEFGRTGELGEPVVLEGLDDVDWASLTTAYGTGEDVPDLLLRMAANDEGWDEAVDVYFTDVVHQGTCYPWTAPTVGFFVQMARAPQLVSAYRKELLFYLLYMATLDPGPACGEYGGHAGPATLTSRAVLEHLPELLARWPDAPPGERALLIALAAFSPDTADRLPEFRTFRDEVDGPSPALDLALALASGDEDAAIGVAFDAAAWDEEVAERLLDDEPPRARHLFVLRHLAEREFAPD